MSQDSGPVLIGSANAEVGMERGMAILRAGGSALDAVEAVIRVVEDNPDDHTVGFGGYPNLLGEVELDASIMDGSTRRAGCVGALKGYRAAISVARGVLERLPHVLVVGEGAARLAAEMGLEEENLLTEEAEKVWRDGLEGRGELGRIGEMMLSRVAALATDPDRAAGTVDVIARDASGNLVSGVSTSGWAWKYPGRLGDSPVIGAGNYCDSRYGAAGCTGWGELAIRAGTARRAVALLASGASVQEAGESVIGDIVQLETGGHHPLMHLVVMGADGSHAGFTTRPEGARYVWWEQGMATPEMAERTVAPQ